MNKREFLAAAVTGAFILRGQAQDGSAAAPRIGGGRPADSRWAPTRKAKTTKLFKAPEGLPNGIAVTDQGLWIAEQKLSGAAAAMYRLEEPKDLSEKAWLVDWNGKVLKTVSTPSRNTSGMAHRPVVSARCRSSVNKCTRPTRRVLL